MNRGDDEDGERGGLTFALVLFSSFLYFLSSFSLSAPFLSLSDCYTTQTWFLFFYVFSLLF